MVPNAIWFGLPIHQKISCDGNLFRFYQLKQKQEHNYNGTKVLHTWKLPYSIEIVQHYTMIFSIISDHSVSKSIIFVHTNKRRHLRSICMQFPLFLWYFPVTGLSSFIWSKQMGVNSTVISQIPDILNLILLLLRAQEGKCKENGESKGILYSMQL